MKHDELAVDERQLQPPQPPPRVTVADWLTGNITCKAHSKPALSATWDGRAKYTRPTNFVMRLRVMFQGCPCVEHFEVKP